MPVVRRAYGLFAAIVLVTMATRIGWIDWTLIGTTAGNLALGVLVFLTLVALLIGAPALILIMFVRWLLKPCPAAPTPSVGPL